MSYVGANPKFTTQLYRPQSADPSNPAEGMVFRADGTSRSKGLWEYREGNWQRFGSDAKTYIANYNIDSSTTSWVAYADAAGVVPVDGTGGSPTTTFTFSSSTPLRGTGSGIITKDAANRQGEGISTDFTIDTADQGKVLQLSFDFTTSSAFVAADYRVFLYDVTNSLLIEGNARDLQANAGYGLYIGNFQTSSNSTSYRLILHCASTNASAYTIKVDNFILSPSQVSQGAITTDWQSYTPTVSGLGTVASVAIYYRRVGDTLKVRGRFVTGTSAASTCSLTLPAGLAIDTAKVPTVSNGEYQGTWIQQASAANSQIYPSAGATGALFFDGSTTGSLFFAYRTGSVVFQKENGSTIFGTGVGVVIEFEVPIAGWSSSITVASQQTNQIIGFRMVKTSGQAIATSGVTKITLTSTASSNGGFDKGGGSDTTNSRWVCPESGLYWIKGNVCASSTDAGNRVLTYIYKNGSLFIRKDHPNSSLASTLDYAVDGTLDLVKGDYIELYSSTATDSSYTAQGNVGFDSQCTLEGYKIQGNQTIGMDEVVACSYETNAGQSIANNSTTVVVFEDKIFDTHNAMNTSTGVYTVPISGTYLITAKVTFNASTSWNVGEAGEGSIRINSTTKARNLFSSPVTTATGIYFATITTYQASLVKGDTIDGSIFQASGASNALLADGSYNQITISRIK